MFKTIKLRRALEQLQSKDPKVRVEAAATLGRLRDARAVEPLVRALQDEPAEVQGRQLSKGQIGDKWTEVRKEAAKALGQLGDARAGEPLTRALQDKSSHVRKEAALALGLIGDRRAVEPLIYTLQNEHGRSDRDYQVCVAAAQALGQIRDAPAVSPFVSPLMLAFEEASVEVREAAMQALVQIGAGVVEPLVGALQDKDRDILLRAGAAKTLGRIGDERAVGPLLEALIVSQKMPQISEAASHALAAIGLPAMPALLRELNDGNSQM